MAKPYRLRSFAPACLLLAIAVTRSWCSVESSADPAARVAELRAEIARHDELYFKQASPEISDSEYDQLKQELAELERQHPELVIAVARGAGFDDRSGRFPTAAHRVPMLSLEKAHDESALRGFFERVTRSAGREDVAFVVEPKIDGIAISVTFQNGRLVRAVTRGDGSRGDDITANLMTILGLPHALAPEPVGALPDLVEVRGEVFLSHEAFERINREREETGEPLFAHPRNAAAGSARLADPEVVAARGLDVVFFGLGACEPAGARPATHRALLSRLESWGLPVVDEVRFARGFAEMWAAVQDLGQRRGSLSYPTDGAVIKVDDGWLGAALGESVEAPRWSIAFKFPPDRASTRVRAIVIQVGRTGLLTPVAEFDPVVLGGATVARASLHNLQALRRRDVRVGDRVVVEKAGEIIPQIVAVDVAARAPDSAPFAVPDRCPACSSMLERETGAGVRCPDLACPAQVRRRLEHFVSRAGVGIEGLGPAGIESLVARGLVRTPADLYRLTPADLAGLGGDDPHAAEARYASVQASRSAALGRVIYGLGIPGVGEATARALASAYPDLSRISELTTADFEPGGCAAGLDLGPAATKAVVAWFAQESNRALVRDLAALGLWPAVPPGGGQVRGGVAGRVFVFTGKLWRFSREEAADRVRAAGGRVGASVSRRTHYLVAGDDPGEKLEVARQLGVPVIDEAELLQLLGEE